MGETKTRPKCARPSVWRKGVRNALNVGKIDALWLPEDRKESDQCNLSSSPGRARSHSSLLGSKTISSLSR